MKLLRFLGDSLTNLREFSEDARHDAGYQLEKVQRGEQPDDFKPMPSIGKGVEEIRMWDDTGTYRVVYTAGLADAVYVLHAFQKKTRATAMRDIELALTRIIHGRFCCNRGFAAATRLRLAGSPFAPSTYYSSMPRVLTASRARLATRLRDFATNRHE